MRILAIALVVFFGIFSQLLCADSLVSQQQLAESLKYYASISRLEVSFKQTKTLNDLGMQLKSEGRLKLIRPDQVVWEITHPSLVRISLDQKEIRIESGKGSEAQVQVMKREDSSSDRLSNSMAGLVAWLNLDSKVLSEQYLIHARDKTHFLFEPKEKKISPFKSLEMELTQQGGQLKHLTLHELSGDRIDIEFSMPQITRK